MNFYKHHLGDYAAGTSHLSWDEDCAYRRLIDQYYKREAPIPVEIKEAFRLARASSPSQRRAVEAVLREFFVLQADGWHQKRCDGELADAEEQGDERSAKAENERERQRRHRAERKRLFEQLRGLDIVPSWDTKTEALRAMLASKHVTSTERDESQITGPPVTQQVTPVTPPVTCTATANQTPDTRHQTPGINTSGTTYPHPPAVRLNGSAAAGLPKPECPPDCPHRRIRDLWAELMPELQQPAKWSEARAAALRSRWREEATEHHWASEEDGLRFFAKLFRWCRKSDFLMGKAPTRPGQTSFAVTVPWLIKAENWAKVQEGNYHHAES